MSFNFGNFYSDRAKVVNDTPNTSSTWRYKSALKGIEISKGMHVLDIGSGSGTLAALIASIPEVDYLGLDISKENVELCKKKYPKKKFIVCNVDQQLLVEDAWADVIFCLEVIEHLKSPYALLENIKRVLKKGGTLVLSAPNPYYWGNILDNILHRTDNEGHLQSFTWKNIEKLCDFLGLKLVSSHTTFDVFLPLRDLNLFPIPAPFGVFSICNVYVISNAS